MSKGSIFTFYSYKGGVGRTFALANIGALLSTWGYKVLCIDWDLEAPGLQFYFQPWMKDQDRPGLVEFVQDYADGKQPQWQNYTTSIHFDNIKTPLLLMKAGEQNDTYVQRMQALNWDTLYSKYDLGHFLEEIRNDWKQSLDFILIDSRTGITDIGGICTVQLPDFLVLLLTANDQSLSGSLDTVERLRKAHDQLPLDHGKTLIMPIISRFERRVEYVESERWLNIFTQKLAPFYTEWIHRDVSLRDILNFTRIPYISFWSFGEKLPVIKPGMEDPEDIGFPLETLAALIAQKLSFTDELIKNRDTFVDVARRGASRQDSPGDKSVAPSETLPSNVPVKIFISYSHYDAPLKNELEKHLAVLRRQKAIQIWSDREIASGTAWSQEINSRLEAADIILLLISPDYLVSPASDREMERALALHEAGKARVIPIILRPVDWQATLITKMQVLPSNGIPVTLWPSKDEVWSGVAAGIRNAIQEFQKSRK
jgi:MinD-like ATPase involved in chromosome partitioning or flagellar assembly